ncbi:2'-5' RNA ligase family protein [Belliella marina]|uniref:2'-5' RNA ligase family protein n=1 Tax=Belliella marina TaxID=1644146 RepID=A0ABW4VIF0_9BACT
MAKIIGKYFIALVPEGEVLKEATKVKEDLMDKFGLKYALKSPAHVTLKMPFSWNEAKEKDLIDRIRDFSSNNESFNLHLKGFGKFGNRVIFIKVRPNPKLIFLQSSLAEFCKRELKLVKELSDSNYHPHMTVAFKDIKAKHFDEYWEYVNKLHFDQKVKFEKLVLLKRKEGRWYPLSELALGDKPKDDGADLI